MNISVETPVKLMIVDDHQLYIDGLKSLLKKVKNITVAAEALNGEQALGILKNMDIDLMITDIEMPGMSGIELTKKVKELYPDVRILVVTMHSDRQIVHEIVMSQAEGYILKNIGQDELINAINRIANNSTYYSNEIIPILTETYIEKEKIREVTKDITPREKEIISLICQELTTAEIADKLFLSPLTVETHRKNILKKTKARTIVGLIKFALENNLSEPF
jgi:DNA-binding NarL/FixJ family response regulator